MRPRLAALKRMVTRAINEEPNLANPAREVLRLIAIADAAEALTHAMMDIHTGIPQAVYPEFVDLEIALKAKGVSDE